MLRKTLLMAMGLVIVPAWIATVKAQTGPAPAEKAQSADDDPFASGPAPVEKAARPNATAKATAPPQKAAQVKPAAKQPQPAAAAKVPLHGGEKAILKALEEETTLDFTETPLQNVIQHLQNKHGIPIKLDAPALKEAGVGLDTPVTCSLSGVPLRSALRIILDELQLQWTIWSDVLWITSPSRAESDEFMVLKVYDVSDLVVETRDRPYRGNGLPTVEADEPRAPVPNYTPPAMMSMPVVGMGGMGGGMGMGGSGTGGMGMGGSGTGGMGGGGMGGGMFALPPEVNAPATISASGSATLWEVCGAVPVVGSVDRGDVAGRPSSTVPPKILAVAGMMPSCCGPVGAGAALPDRRGEVDTLMDMIKDLVAPKSWMDNGGSGAISSQQGDLLCIYQTFQVQCEIKAFLADLRTQRRAAPNVVVELQWLWLDGGQYQQLLGGAKRSGDEPTHMAVDAKALDRLGRTAPGFRGRIACANGQLVHLASGDRRSIIVSTVPAPGGGHSPVVQTPNAGVVVQLRPSVVSGGKTAIVDLQSVVTRWGKPQATAQAGTASGPVQQANMPAQQLATTVRVPLGKPVLIGGMTFASTGPSGMDRASDDPTQLYLIATTSIAE